MGELDPSSFHSSIPMNKEHSRRALAYDLALGQARSIDDEVFYAYLCRMADWRLRRAEDGGGHNADGVEMQLPDANMLRLYAAELPDIRALSEATDGYRRAGILPSIASRARRPALVMSQTLEDRARNRPPMPGEGSAA